MRKTILIAALVAALALPATASSGPDPDASTAGLKSRLVRVEDNFFDPDVIGVKVGQVVRFKWMGVDFHDVTGPGKDSEIMNEGTFKKRFTNAKNYKYKCTLHPDEMRIKIKVKE